MTSYYACSDCEELFEDLQALNTHAELECTEGDGGGTAYCCGMIYEDGESSCDSCGEPL
ncbi:hypothetical protein ACWEO1_16855 [Kitasatospora cineracea]